MLMLVGLARWRTDQPQSWALVPALGIGVVGLALLILGPSDRVLGWLGWVWPLLLVLVVVWSVRGARRSLHNWSRRALLYPAFAILALIALGGAFETVAEATTENNPPAGGRTYVVAGRTPLSALHGFGVSGCDLVQWAWASALRAGRGCKEMSRARLASVCSIAPAKVGVERLPVARTRISFPPTCSGLLAAADVPGPYVLAGHSVGGTYALAYAMDYPKDVAGVALIDSATPYQFDLPWYPRFYSLWRRGSALLPTLARAGVARVYSLSTASVRCRRMPVARRGRSAPRRVSCGPIVMSSRSCRRSFVRTRLLRVSAESRSSYFRPMLDRMSGWSAAQESSQLSRQTAFTRRRTARHTRRSLKTGSYAAISSRAIDAVVRSVRTGGPLAALDPSEPSSEVERPSLSGPAVRARRHRC